MVFNANHVLGRIDHFIKEQLQVKAYVRYMDDMVLWGNSKVQLLENGRLVQKFIEEQLLQCLKPFCLNSTSKGLPFLGYLLFPAYIKLMERSGKRFVSKLKMYCRNLERGTWSQSDFQVHMQPLLAFTRHARARAFRKSVISNISGQYPQALTA